MAKYQGQVSLQSSRSINDHRYKIGSAFLILFFLLQTSLVKGQLVLNPVINDILSFDIPTSTQLNSSQRNGTAVDFCVRNQDGRGFLLELMDHGDIKVPYEWIPVIGGPDPTPTIDQPLFYMAGSIEDFSLSNVDFRPAHPFGFYDYDFKINVDSSYRELIYNPCVAPCVLNLQDELGLEIERGLFPFTDFRFYPQKGDRILSIGSWILDSGHTPYHSEIHPPAFLSFARNVNDTTVSFSYAIPYRVTQLYNPDPGLASKFEDYERFNSPQSRSFPHHLADKDIWHIENGGEVQKACYNWGAGQLEAHPLIEALDYRDYPTVITWFVSPPPVWTNGNDKLDLRSKYHFTVREGVGLQVVPLKDLGTVMIMAVIGPSYNPFPITPSHVPWPWNEIHSELFFNDPNLSTSTIDLREFFKQKCRDEAHLYLAGWPSINKDPLIDSYEDLRPKPGDNLDLSLNQITVDNTQPFPFYGWVNVWWEKRGNPPYNFDLCTYVDAKFIRRSPISFEPAALYFKRSQPNVKTAVVTNPSNEKITVDDLVISGANYKSFDILNENCKGKQLNPGEYCKVSIKYSPTAKGKNVAELRVITKGYCPAKLVMEGDGID